MNSLVALAGLAAALVGVALLSFPVALILAGLLLVYLAVRGDEQRRSPAPSSPPRHPAHSET